MAFTRLSEIVAKVFKTDDAGNRIVIEGANVDGVSGGKFRLYTADPDEVDETRIYVVVVGTGDAKQEVTVIQNGRIGGPVTDVRNNVYFYSGSHDGGITFPPSVDIPYAQVIQALVASLRVKSLTTSGKATIGNGADITGLLHALGAATVDGLLTASGPWNVAGLGVNDPSSGNVEDLYDTGWQGFTLGNSVDAPWGASSVQNYAEYRRQGDDVTVRFAKTASSSAYTGAASGNFADINVSAVGAMPAALIPTRNTPLDAMWNDLPLTMFLQGSSAANPGTFTIRGGIPSGAYGTSQQLVAIGNYKRG